jgi:hypothetical protein
MVHVVAIPWLGRAAVAATVMRNAAIAFFCQEDHLRFPAVGVQWPTVAEYNWLAILRGTSKNYLSHGMMSAHQT